MPIIDFYDDSTGAVMREILLGNGMQAPEYVLKSATLVPSEEFRREKSMFGWESARKFPLDTPEDTWLSAQFFGKTAHLVPFQFHEHIINNIKAAADIHGIEVAFSLEKEATADAIPDEAFLLVAEVPLYGALAKAAALGDLGIEVVSADTGKVKLYPAHTKEAVEKAVAWFPRNLDAELAPYRRTVAQGLLQKCAEFDVTPSILIQEELLPIKRSHLLNHVRQRIAFIEGHNTDAARVNGLIKGAADRGVDLPYKLEPKQVMDIRFITAYQELTKLAYQDEVPAKFFDQLDRLDKAAGFDGRPEITPAVALNREIEDDMVQTTCKLAGTIVFLPQLMEKVSATMWADVAPEVLENMYDFRKVARTIEGLDDLKQQILLGKLRGF